MAVKIDGTNGVLDIAALNLENITSTNVNATDIDTNSLVLDTKVISKGDDNTFLEFHGENQFRVVTGGAERLEVSNVNCIVQNQLSVIGEILCGTGIKINNQTVWHNGNDALSLSGNGFLEFPNGFQLVWGSFTSNTDTAQTVNFHRTFSSTYGVILDTIPSNPLTLRSDSFTLDRFDSVNSSPTVRYLAYGSN